jgi:hypothetical protein
MEGKKEVKKDTYEVYEGRTGTKAGRKEGRKKGR